MGGEREKEREREGERGRGRKGGGRANGPHVAAQRDLFLPTCSSCSFKWGLPLKAINFATLRDTLPPSLPLSLSVSLSVLECLAVV